MAVNPLIAIIHDRYLDRPDSLVRRNSTATKREWNPVAAAIAKMGAIICWYGHNWTKGEKAMYRRAIQSTIHPCCPTCGKPMSESLVTTAEGTVHRSWYCESHQNL